MTSRIAATALGLAALLLAAAPARAQDPEPEPVLPGGVSADALVEGRRRLPQILRNIPRHIKAREWHTVAHGLHMLLDAPGGALLQERGQDADGRPFVRWHSPHIQANALLAWLPPEALKVYNEHYGILGRDLLDRAKRANDPRLLVQVVRRFLYTAAGPEALTLLGGHYFAAGRYLPAALCYRRLLDHPRAAPDAVTLYRAATASRLAGDRPGADRAWKRLEARLGKGTVALGDRRLTVQEVRQELERVAPAGKGTAADWLLFQGNPARAGTAAGSSPLPEKQLWQRRTIMDVFEESGEVDKGKEAKPWLDRVLIKRLGERDSPLLPGFFPLAAGDKVVYRTYAGVTCVQLTPLKDKKGNLEAKPGEIEWKSTELDGSLGMLFADVNLRPPVQGWVQSCESQGFGGVLFENPAVGTLSCDGSSVYVVDTLAVPPAGKAATGTPALEQLTAQNSLQAYQLKTGKIEWRKGAAGGKGDEFSRTHWLGAPLPLGGALYALNETGNGELRLLTLDGVRGGKVLAQQTLAAVRDRIGSDPLRRTQPVHLAYGEGVLVCPTNAGAVLGVDLLTESVVWAYTYRAARPAPPPPPRMPAQAPLNLRPEWHNAAPVVQGGKLVFTAPDEVSVHCVSLRDGALLWKAKRDDDLYLAGVFGGRVLLVGKSACRALDLADGKQLWRVETGVPSGMGVAADGRYYLPLRNAAGGKGPAICALDLDKEAVVRVYTGLKEIPGNLLIHGGQLISQGPTTVTAYAVVASKRK
jgi:outer membrane protein assembly factor BamB